MLNLPGIPVHGLTAEQLEIIQEFKSKVLRREKSKEEEVVQEMMLEKYGGEDFCCFRFLKGREFSVEKAQEMFLNTLNWRMKTNVDQCLSTQADLFKEVLPQWPGGFHKIASNGSPTVILRVGKVNLSKLLEHGEEKLTQFYICWMEMSLKLQRLSFGRREAENPHPKDGPMIYGMIEIYDLTGLSISQLNFTALNMLSRVLRIGQEHYPENLHKGFILNAPYIFSTAWKIIRPVLHANTQAKISLTSHLNTEVIIKLLPEQDLPSFLGGKDESFPGMSFEGDIDWEFEKSS